VSVAGTRPLVRLELEPADVALVALALEQLIERESSSSIAERAVVLAAYLRLQRHQALRRDNDGGGGGATDPLP
jgi:hypothetical protein